MYSFFVKSNYFIHLNRHIVCPCAFLRQVTNFTGMTYTLHQFEVVLQNVNACVTEMSIFMGASVFIGGFGNHGSSTISLIFMKRYEVMDFKGFSNNIS